MIIDFVLIDEITSQGTDTNTIEFMVGTRYNSPLSWEIPSYNYYNYSDYTDYSYFILESRYLGVYNQNFQEFL